MDTTMDTTVAEPLREQRFDLAAEQAVLGAMMLTEQAITDVEPILGDGKGFYRPAHTTIYRAILELRDAGAPTDPIAVVSHLTDAGVITRVGGMSYIHDLTRAVPNPASAGYYAQLVAGTALLRAISEHAARVDHLARTASPADANTVLEQVRELLAGLGPQSGGDTLRQWRDITPNLLTQIELSENAPEGVAGIATGWHDLDQLLTGLRPGQLVLFGARPGVGKSVALINLAMEAAMKQGRRTLLFSLEMSELEIGERIASAGTGIPLQNIRTGRLTDEDWTRLARYIGDTDAAPLYVDDTARATIAHIRAQANRLAAQLGGIDLILVDYLQLAEGAGGRESRQEQVAALSRGLKLLAKDLGVPVVAASQLNRGAEHRSDKRPSLSDLRESGALEQDADIVVLLHREDVHDQESPRAGEADFIVAKNRNGPTDTVTLAGQLHCCRFRSMALPTGM